MQKKFTPVLDRLLPGLVLLALGIAILYWKTEVLRLALFLTALVAIFTGLAMLLMLLLRRKELRGRRVRLSTALISIAIGVAMLFLFDAHIVAFSILFTVYVLINAAAKIVNFILFSKNRVQGRLTDLFDSIFFLTFGILLLFTPLFSIDSIMIIIGVYAILLGSFNVLEFIRSVIPSKTKKQFRRSIRISLPVFIVMLVPHRVLRKMNQVFQEGTEEGEGPSIRFETKEGLDTPPDLEVFIHVTEKGSGVMGHCDFFFNGKVYSYGNYDESSRRLFEGAGDGVLFFAPKEKYVPFVTRYSRKTLFDFGLRLTTEQREALQNRLDEICEPLYRWKSPYETDEDSGTTKPLAYYPDYASQLFHYTGAEFYKFHSGRFKSYFVLSTNCVQLVDSALSSAGTAIVKINGIVTPGTYYDYLDDEFRKPDSMVVSRTVYTENQANEAGIPRESDVRAHYKELCEEESKEGFPSSTLEK